jgi:hypothetical protein
MVRFIKFLFIGIPILSSVVQAGDCNSVDIKNKNVANCDCQGHNNDCYPASCKICNLNIDNRLTKSCVPGCTDADKKCKGCGLWFSTLCNHLKDCLKGKQCDASGKVQTNGPMVYVYLPEDEPLITTTNPLPGILEMADHASTYKDAFNFAQEPKNFDPSRQALVLNSVRARTMEQFHIHVCYRPTDQNPRVLARLDKAKLNPSKTLKEIPPMGQKDPGLWCVSVEKGKGPVTGFVESIAGLLASAPPPCKGLAGAGIIQDNHGNRWGCVTDNQQGPLPYFCSGHDH